MPRIAIIDDIIYDNALRKPVAERYCLNSRSSGKYNDSGNGLSHGTLVARTMEEYMSDYELVSIQILDNWFEQPKASIKMLEAALELCTKIKIDIINISLGTERLSDIMCVKKSIKDLYSSNVPIIAALSNAGFRTIPASCGSVIGVACDKKGMLKAGEYGIIKRPYLGINFIANYDLALKGDISFTKCNSLATPVITAQVNNLLLQSQIQSIPELLNKLNDNAIYITNSEESRGFDKFCLDIPVVSLVDVFANDYNKQLLLLDEFALHGYEAIGLTSIDCDDDVRLFSISCSPEESIGDIIKCFSARVRADILLVFSGLNMWRNSDFDEIDATIFLENQVIPNAVSMQSQVSVVEANTSVSGVFNQVRKMF